MQVATTHTPTLIDKGQLAPGLGRELFSVADLRVMTGLADNTLRSAIRRGELPSVRVGRRVLIPRRKFEAWLDGAEDTASGEEG